MSRARPFVGHLETHSVIYPVYFSYTNAVDGDFATQFWSFNKTGKPDQDVLRRLLENQRPKDKSEMTDDDTLVLGFQRKSEEPVQWIIEQWEHGKFSVASVPRLQILKNACLALYGKKPPSSLLLDISECAEKEALSLADCGLWQDFKRTAQEGKWKA